MRNACLIPASWTVAHVCHAEHTAKPRISDLAPDKMQDCTLKLMVRCRMGVDICAKDFLLPCFAYFQSQHGNNVICHAWTRSADSHCSHKK